MSVGVRCHALNHELVSSAYGEVVGVIDYAYVIVFVAIDQQRPSQTNNKATTKK